MSKGHGKKGASDYDGWIMRLVKRAEDIRSVFSLWDWLEFCNKAHLEYHGYPLSDAQQDYLTDAHNNGDIWNKIEADTGLSLERPFRTKSQVVIRGPGGRFVSRAEANRQILEKQASTRWERWQGKGKK